MNCRKCGAKRITRRSAGVFSCAHCGVQPGPMGLTRFGLKGVNIAMNNPLYEIENHMPDFRRSLADKVPEHLREGLARYILRGITPGSFLRAVLCNDLHGAIRHGDDDSIAGLRDIIMFLNNDCPTGCFGHPEKFSDWCRHGGFVGIEA